MYINCVAIYLAVLLIVSFFKQIKKILFLLMIVLTGLAVILDNFWGVDIYEYQYNSPSQTTTLVIEESAFLLGSTVTAYEKKNGIFKKKIPEVIFNIDDGFTPFKHGMFRLNWISDKEVDITYYTNLGDRWKSEKVVFK
ncbi:hypothetical protein SDC9_201757 [bioreactor metagenome]|uniref:Uncharacterized protein n=1 Tax=bioreactor metagenome TaxID=1076179 RepID=A0A645IRT9_9ZZZZ